MKRLHEHHHFGVDCSIYLARLVDPTVHRNEILQRVRECIQCQSIDPAPTTHELGDLEVKRIWQRLAVDVTHFESSKYFTMGLFPFEVRRLQFQPVSCLHCIAVFEQLSK